MIPRYTRDEMAKIWTDEAKFTHMMDIEILACEAMVEIGDIPPEDAKTIREKASFTLDRIREIEKEVHHDVIAFVSTISENVGAPASRHIHQGLTSSDVLDTAFALQMRDAGRLLLTGIKRLKEVLKTRATEHKSTICMGRSHGIHAEPTSFGLKLAGHYAAFKRHYEHLEKAIDVISTCALSGAVGTYATLDPRIEAYVSEKLGLSIEPHSTQIIPRDRHAHFVAVLGNVANSLENLSVEIRHLQRSEVREAFEYFDRHQKGSSAMPHKKNPVLSENITGLARLIRAQVIPAFENVALWHERDISHSSVERVSLPDATMALDFALHRMAGVIEKLIIDKKQMRRNVEALRGLIFSQKTLLALTRAGMNRDEAYRLVQKEALRVWDDESLHFKALIMDNEEIRNYLDEATINNLFNLDQYLVHIDVIWSRIFNDH